MKSSEILKILKILAPSMSKFYQRVSGASELPVTGSCWNRQLKLLSEAAAVQFPFPLSAGRV